MPIADRSRTGIAPRVPPCTYSTKRTTRPSGVRGPRQDTFLTRWLFLDEEVVRRLVRRTNRDGVGPRVDLLGPGLLRVENGDEVGVVLGFLLDDGVPRPELSVEDRLRRRDDLDAPVQQLLVVVGVLADLPPFA